jgi:hypothetical protein
LAILNLTLLGLTLRNRDLSAALAGQTAEIEANLAQLQQTESQGMEALQEELSQAEAELARLKASFPDVGAGFNLFRRGFELAQENRVQVESIERLGTTTQSTAAGDLLLTSYRLQGRADLNSCLAFLSSLEREGLDTLALTSIQIRPDSERCNLNVDIASAGGAEGPD